MSVSLIFLALKQISNFFGQVCGCCGWGKQLNIRISKTTFEQWLLFQLILASFSILQTKSDRLCTYDPNWFIEVHVSPHDQCIHMFYNCDALMKGKNL